MTDPSAAILSSFSSAIASVVARAAPSVVSVHSHRSRASGFVWKPGLVVTADEALAEEGEISIKLPDGTARPGHIAGRDHTTDIALLRFDAKEIAPIKLLPEVPALGSLSIVVAAERGAACRSARHHLAHRRPLAQPSRRRHRRPDRTRHPAASQPPGWPCAECRG